MARRYYHRFTATGQSAFPLDMLRYDACYPNSTEAASEIAESLSREARSDRRRVGGPFVVDLTSHVGPAETARWSSFGWRISNERKDVLGG